MDRNFNINEDLSNISTTPSDVNNVINNLQIVGNVIDTTLNRTSNVAKESTTPAFIKINGKYPERNYITFDVSLLSNVTPYSSNIFRPVWRSILVPNPITGNDTTNDLGVDNVRETPPIRTGGNTTTPNDVPVINVNFTLLGRTLVDSDTNSLACTTYVTGRAYFSTIALFNLDIGDLIYDSIDDNVQFPPSLTNGNDKWIALKQNGIGAARSLQISSNGEILDIIDCIDVVAPGGGGTPGGGVAPPRPAGIGGGVPGGGTSGGGTPLPRP
jgi:hypothetical protein